jgi:DNA mismatch repair protein MutS2
LLRGFLSGPISAPLLDSLQPHTEIEAIRRDLERAREAREFLRAGTRPSLVALEDTRPLLEELRVEGAMLPALGVLALVELAKTAVELRRRFADGPWPHLDGLARGMADFRGLVAALGGKILPDGTLDSSASPALARIRRAQERLRQDIKASLERLLRRFAHEGVLQDAVITLRNDRFVIPVRAEEKRRVAGVIHAASSSGATVFVEPLETVPLNNEMVELQDQELAEVQRILAEFSRELQACRAELLGATEILSELDVAFAKAEFSRQYDACIPEFTADRVLWLRDARHPLLEKALHGQGRKPVPLTIELKAPKTLMVISGPNAGGKTVALKTLGTAALMAQAGIPIPASEARLPLFGRVLADIGDQQSIEANLSTFSAHVRNIQAMAQAAEGNDLVLLDEIGASTEPSEGAALGVAILEYFRRRGPMTFVTTHHSRLKAFGAETFEAVNAAMEFDEATLQPTYRLLSGLPGKSSALDIAQRLGLEPSIVEKARTLLPTADAEAASLVAKLHEQQAGLQQQLAALAEQRKELTAQHEELEKQFQQDRRARLKELDSRLEQTLRQYARHWDETIAELRRQGAAASVVATAERKAVKLERQIREEWNAQVLEALGAAGPLEASPPDRPLTVGDPVRVVNVSTPGTVTALLGEDGVEVALGGMHMRVHKNEVRLLSQDRGPRPGSVSMALGAEDVPEQLNVIGSTAEEARERVDKFLDQAYLSGRLRLRIVHGHGKGILRKTLHEMFASHPHVQKFYPAPRNEGGSGATIVELRA